MQITVNTPKGVKFHGEVKEVGGFRVFYREVDYDKDRMRIYDAWSIHPDALKQIEKLNVEKMLYKDKEGTEYLISLAHAKKKGWEGGFAGGKTFYIPLKFWDNDSIKQNRIDI